MVGKPQGFDFLKIKTLAILEKGCSVLTRVARVSAPMVVSQKGHKNFPNVTVQYIAGGFLHGVFVCNILSTINLSLYRYQLQLRTVREQKVVKSFP